MVRLKIVATALMLTMGSVSVSQAAEYTVRFSHIHPPGATSKSIAAEYFADELEARSEGRIEVRLHPSGELFGDQQGIQALQGGVIEMLAPSTALLTTIAPEIGVLDLPFLIEEGQVLADVIQPGTKIHELIYENENFLSRNIRVIDLWDYGHKHIWTNTETRSYGDLSGQQLRVVGGSDPLRFMMQAWDINPTGMALGEVYNGIQQGVIDGFDNGFITAQALSIYEVTDYVVETNHGYNTFGLLMNNQFFNSLPVDLQELVTEVAAEATAVSAEMLEEKSTQAEEHIRADGSTEFITLSDEDLALMRQAAIPSVWERSASIIGEDVITELLEQK